MRTPRDPEAIERVRQQILASALEILVDEGFAALTMRRLARRTGMTAPNLYNYFPAKDALYITLMRQGFDVLIGEVRTAADGELEPTARARAAMRAYVEFGRREPRTYALMFSSTTPKYRDFVGTPFEAESAAEHAVSLELADLALELVREVAAGAGHPIDATAARTVLAAIWSLLHGLVALAHAGNLAYVVDDVEETVTAILERLTDPESTARLLGRGGPR